MATSRTHGISPHRRGTSCQSGALTVGRDGACFHGHQRMSIGKTRGWCIHTPSDGRQDASSHCEASCLKPPTILHRRRAVGMRRGSTKQLLLVKRLHTLLQRLPQHKRRFILEHRLSEDQRLTLEAWILKGRMAKPATHQQRQSRQCRRDALLRATPPDCRSKQVRAHACGNSRNSWCRATKLREQRKRPRFIAPPSPLSTSASPAPARTPKRKQEVGELEGLTRHFRGLGLARCTYYSSEITVEGLRLLTKTARDPEVALRYHSALKAIQRGTSKSTGSFESRFRSALSETMAEFGVTPEIMGLKCVVSLHVLWVSRPLRTSPYSVTKHLDEGLRAWRRLHEARGTIGHRNGVLRNHSPQELECQWARLRQEFLALASESRGRTAHVEAMLDQAQAEHAERQEKQLERWNALRMAEEERTQRVLERQAQFLKHRREAEASAESSLDTLLERWGGQPCGATGAGSRTHANTGSAIASSAAGAAAATAATVGADVEQLAPAASSRFVDLPDFAVPVQRPPALDWAAKFVRPPRPSGPWAGAADGDGARLHVSSSPDTASAAPAGSANCQCPPQTPAPSDVGDVDAAPDFGAPSPDAGASYFLCVDHLGLWGGAADRDVARLHVAASPGTAFVARSIVCQRLGDADAAPDFGAPSPRACPSSVLGVIHLGLRPTQAVSERFPRLPDKLSVSGASRRVAAEEVVATSPLSSKRARQTTVAPSHSRSQEGPPPPDITWLGSTFCSFSLADEGSLSAPLASH
mmetsp:Transcript_51470/g.166936  ORF Transcript_51470/g.166936 Transcript_51470/m.166936 type:complete len:757 (+) Transcript_51470:359-2629(+)